LDLNKDGKLDSKDAEVALEQVLRCQVSIFCFVASMTLWHWQQVQRVLSFNMPSGGGFTAGFFMGLRG